MRIIPKLEIKDKKCFFGSRLSKSEYPENPKAAAEILLAQGAKLVHLVDLDAQKVGRLVNFDVIDQVSFIAPLQVEAGIRSEAVLRKLVGIDARVAVPASALEKEGFRRTVNEFKSRVSVVIGTGEKIAGGQDIFGFAKENEGICSAIILVDAGEKGKTDFEMVKKMKKAVSISVIAECGIESYEELKELKKTGIYGCIIGKGLYSGKIELERAIREAK